MRAYSAQTLIEASIDTVWAVITDGEAYTAWDSGITKVDGAIVDGAKITIHTPLSKRTFPVKVACASDHTSMTWTGGMPLGLFTGVRTFTLSPEGDAVRLTVREEYTGPMTETIWKSMPDLQPSFDQYVAGAKTRAEQLN